MGRSTTKWAYRARIGSAGPGGRSWLELHEVAFVLGMSAREADKMLRRGGFRDVRAARRRGVAAAQVAELTESRWLALETLDAIVAGRLRVRKPADIDAQPPTLMESWDALW